MLAELLLPDANKLKYECAHLEDNKLVITVSTKTHAAICPKCEQRSDHQHGSYKRDIADVPWADFVTQLKVRVKRFRCLNVDCCKVTFAERIPTVARPFARRTQRLVEKQQWVAFEISAEVGSAILRMLNMEISPDLLLRLVRAAPENIVVTPRVLGVDDWAICKGQSYGTILVDLEGQFAIDLLPDSTAATLTAWLQAHPGVEIISRDRGPEYIKAATQCSPHWTVRMGRQKLSR